MSRGYQLKVCQADLEMVRNGGGRAGGELYNADNNSTDYQINMSPLNTYDVSMDNMTYMVRGILMTAPPITSTTTTSSVHSPTDFDDDQPMLTLGWFESILLLLCIFGISGNILNLLVLTRRRFCSSLNKLESSANYGLIALAVSDLCFCLVVLPHVFISGRPIKDGSTSEAIRYHYRVFGVATINLFLMISTWIIIIIAVNRWIVVVYPLKAKAMLSRQSTYFSILTVYVLSVLFTLPYYLHMSIRPCRTLTGIAKYEFYDMYDPLVTNYLRFYIRWIWPIIADFIPLIILGLCNIRLVLEIKKTTSGNDIALGRRTSRRSFRQNGSKVTVTLVSIIVMYLVLVTPCEMMKYINPYSAWGRVGYIIANATNALQTANFAFNFVLYCLVNATFRQTLKDMITPGAGSRSSSFKMGTTGGSQLEERQAMIVRRHSKNFTMISSL